jgi:L-2-hydroxyglutarate oxidase
MSTPSYDVVVIGGGIVGVATARALSLHGRHRVLIMEAEPRLAQHQTGRNSGVIHAGLYYRPGSDKARLCAAGREALYRFCEDHQIPFRRCGKLVVATDQEQIPALDGLEKRAHANGLTGVQRLDRSGIREREPAANGVAGLWIPQTGIVDFAAVTDALAIDVKDRDGELVLDSRVRKIRRQGDWIRVESPNLEVRGRLLINCAGLHGDRVARLAGVEPQIRLIPFRGEYYEAEGPATELVRGLIYPVPDPRFPFLGVHWTRTIDDRVLAGPNAVPALKREGYRRSDISLRDVADILAFPGFWRLAAGFWRTGLAEMRRSLNKRAFVQEAQRLVAQISAGDLRPAPSGVRAQAVDRSGKLLDDFFILQEERMIHVLNAPSPAATASLAIGEHIAKLAKTAF